MSSIREVQIRRVLSDIIRSLYSTGVKPSLNDIFTELSEYFNDNPTGQPLSVDIPFDHSGRSNPEAFNEIMARTLLNLHTLYEATASQVSDIMELTSVVRVRLQQLDSRRRRLLEQVNNYLLSLYNSDGYYYSFGDSFPDLVHTDLDYTSAFVDTQVGAVTIPTISTLTRAIPAYLITQTGLTANVTPLNASGTTDLTTVAPYRLISEISGAFDGLTNTVWGIEVEADEPSEVVVELVLALGNENSPADISRVDFDPHTITPIQTFIEVGTSKADGSGIEYSTFGNSIQTSLNKVSFTNPLVRAKTLRFTFRKTEHDYIDTTTDTVKYKYVFGAKEITIIHNIYDRSATWVSTPIHIPWSASGADTVIDAVSLVADRDLPSGTEINFYIANDNDDATEVSDFDWQPIRPLGTVTDEKNLIVRFNGAQQLRRKITSEPAANELQLIAPDSTATDLRERNPSAVIIDGVDMYRICEFTDSFLDRSISLEEGVDTTRIYYSTYTEGAAVMDLSDWASLIASTTPPEVTYGTINSGNDFFYGGTVGASGKNVLIETYVDVAERTEPVFAEFRKSDVNSVYWPMVVYLNGREVASIPAGTSKVLIPWVFKRGRNHIAISLVIPYATDDLPHPYIGTIALMGDASLSDYGRVKLADWHYVSFFDMQYNQAREPYTFTIHNEEIVSRRQPTTDFVVSYFRSTGEGPQEIRLKAEMSRDIDRPDVSPKLNSYRLRFSYYNR